MNYGLFSGKHAVQFSPSVFYNNMVTKACVERRCAEEELHCLQWLI